MTTTTTSNTTTTAAADAANVRSGTTIKAISKLYVLGVTILYYFHWNHHQQQHHHHHQQQQRLGQQQHPRLQEEEVQQLLGTPSPSTRTGGSGSGSEIKMNNYCTNDDENNDDENDECIPLTATIATTTSTTSTSGNSTSRRRRSNKMTNFEISSSVPSTTTVDYADDDVYTGANDNKNTGGGVFSGSILCCMPCFDGWLLGSSSSENNDRTFVDFDIFKKNKDDNGQTVVEGHAFDIIIVQNSDTGRLFQNSDFTVFFPEVRSKQYTTKSSSSKSMSTETEEDNSTFRSDRRRQQQQQQKQPNDYKVVLEIHGREDRNNGRPVWFPIHQKKKRNEKSTTKKMKSRRGKRSKSGKETNEGWKSRQQDSSVDEENSQNQADLDADDDHDDDDDDNSDSSRETTVVSDDDQRFWGCCHPDAGYVPPKTISTNFHTLSRTTESTTTGKNRLENENGDDPDQNQNNGKGHDDPTMALKPFLSTGKNTVRYLLLDDTTVIGVAYASIFLWQHTDQLVICDIDGTITKSNARGVIDTLVTRQYRHCHDGVCKMLTRLLGHGQTNDEEEFRTEMKDEDEDKVLSPTRRILYVTSRPLTLVNPTRSFLTSLTQDNWSLPHGPVLGFNGSLLKVGLMEAFSRTTHHFKAETILRNVVEPFQRATNEAKKTHDEGTEKEPSVLSSAPFFLAGFGNTLMDIRAYHAVGVEVDRLFLINKQSKIVTFDKEHALFDRRQNRQNSNNRISDTPSNETVRMDGIFISVTFRHQDWYKQRIGRSFDGYNDGTLISRFQTLGDRIDDVLSSTNGFQDEELLPVV